MHYLSKNPPNWNLKGSQAMMWENYIYHLVSIISLEVEGHGSQNIGGAAAPPAPPPEPSLTSSFTLVPYYCIGTFQKIS